MTWEEAMEYARVNIDRVCAKQGIPVEITDPYLIDLSVRILSEGRRRYEEQLAADRTPEHPQIERTE